MRFPFICCGIGLVLLVHLRMTGWLMKTISSSIYEKSEEATHADDRLELASLVNSLLKHLLQLERIDVQDDFPEHQYYNYSDTEHLNNTEHDSDPPTMIIPKKHDYINCSNVGDNQDRTNQTNSGQGNSSLTSCQQIIPEMPKADDPLMTRNNHNADKINELCDQISACLACCEVCDCKSSCDKTNAIICNPECNIGCGKQLCKVSACNSHKSCEKSNACDTSCKDCQLSRHLDCSDICKFGCNKCQLIECPTCSTNTHTSCFKSSTKTNIWDNEGKDCQLNYDICNLGCNMCPTCKCAENLDNRGNKNNCKMPGGHCELLRYNNYGINCNHGKNIYDLPGNQCQPLCHQNYGDICNLGCDSCHSQSFKYLTNTCHNNRIPLYQSNAHHAACSNMPYKHIVLPKHCTCSQSCNLNCFVAPVVTCSHTVCHPVCNGCRQPCIKSCCHQPWNQRGCFSTPSMPGRYPVPVNLPWNIYYRCYCPQERIHYFNMI